MGTMEVVTYKDLNIHINRRAFKRSMSLTVRPSGEIRVSTGKLYPLPFILRFVEEKENWLRKHLDKFQREKGIAPELQAGDRVPFMGRELELRWQVYSANDSTLSKSTGDFSLEQNFLSLSISSKDFLLRQKRLEKIKEFYQSEAQKHLLSRTNQVSCKMGLFPRRISFRGAKTRWGSCNYQRRLILNWKLILYPSDVIDYVIVHELAHLKHMNHSLHFWKLVSSVHPRAKECRRYLRTNYKLTNFLDEKD